jgi:DNA-directed RNA polymerase subunit RPC12/RpoP
MTERWPIHTDLKGDETLLSLLVRTALVNGSYPHVLFQSWRNSKHTFNSDIDKTVSQNALNRLSSNTGISINTLQKSLLIDLIKPLLSEEQYENTRSWRYVMHIGARNHRRSFGYGFCPECMAHDQSSYYRRHWRLLWHVGCSEHQCQLVYDCPACGTENKPHTLSFQAKSINECSHCGHALSNASKIAVHADALTVASWMDHYIRTGINTSQWSFPNAQEAALTLRQLMSIVRSTLSKRYIRYNQAMLDWMGIDRDILIDTQSTTHEQWSLSLREVTLRGAWRLLSTAPDELIAHCQSINMSQTFWLHDNKTKTAAIHRIADHLKTNEKSGNKTRICNRLIEPLPRAEVESRWQSIRDQLKELNK